MFPFSNIVASQPPIQAIVCSSGAHEPSLCRQLRSESKEPATIDEGVRKQKKFIIGAHRRSAREPPSRKRGKRKHVTDTLRELQKCRNYVLQFSWIAQLVSEIDNADASGTDLKFNRVGTSSCIECG